MKLINKFINQNKLDLLCEESELNGVCTILAGYSLYLGYVKPEKVIEDLTEPPTEEFKKEFTRVFNYAYENDYEDYWDTEKAKEQYIY